MSLVDQRTRRQRHHDTPMLKPNYVRQHGHIENQAQRMACPCSVTVMECWWPCFVQIQGKDRALVAEAGLKLDLEGTYIARSYIEQVCM